VPLLRFNRTSEENPRGLVEALVSDLEKACPKYGARVTSVFFAAARRACFPLVRSRLDLGVSPRLTLTADCEIRWSESGTFEAEKFRGYRDAGVTACRRHPELRPEASRAWPHPR